MYMSQKSIAKLLLNFLLLFGKKTRENVCIFWQKKWPRKSREGGNAFWSRNLLSEGYRHTKYGVYQSILSWWKFQFWDHRGIFVQVLKGENVNCERFKRLNTATMCTKKNFRILKSIFFQKNIRCRIELAEYLKKTPPPRGRKQNKSFDFLAH